MYKDEQGQKGIQMVEGLARVQGREGFCFLDSNLTAFWVPKAPRLRQVES